MISNQPQNLSNSIINLKHISSQELVLQIRLIYLNLKLNHKYHRNSSGDRTHNFVTLSVGDRTNRAIGKKMLVIQFLST